MKGIKGFKSMIAESLKNQQTLSVFEDMMNIAKTNMEEFSAVEENKSNVKNYKQDEHEDEDENENENENEYNEEYKELEMKCKELIFRVENISSENDDLKEKNIKISKDLDDLQELKVSQIKELEDSYKLKIKEIEDRENKLIIINSKLKNEFNDIRLAYSTYNDLEESIKKQLDGIFKGRNIENFLYSGVQYKSIESLWEYIKILSINGKIENLIQLNDIFKNLLNAYNSIYENPLYKIQEVEIGESFDEDKFIRGYNSKINGNIEEIYVLGYINLNTKNVVKKSVVKV